MNKEIDSTKLFEIFEYQKIHLNIWLMQQHIHQVYLVYEVCITKQHLTQMYINSEG